MSTRKLATGLHLHFDPESGIAGDMTIAALVDAGVPKAIVSEAVAAMGVPGLKTRFERRQRGAYVGTGFVVTWPGQDAPTGRARAREKVTKRGQGRLGAGKVAKRGQGRVAAGHADHHHDHADHDHDHADHDHGHADHHHDHGHADHHHDHGHADHHHDHGQAHAHRDYAEIRRLLKRARLAPGAREIAEEIFARIAEVEAALHGTGVDEVAFHEVGAFDSIADVVGVAAVLAFLEPASVSAAPPVLGSGTVRTAHGPVPVPAPATAALLAATPVRAEGRGELTTPTGAAILAVTVDTFGPMPPVRLVAQGFGAGTRELPDRPNVLRVLLGEPLGRPLAAPPQQVRLLQANVDDMSAQLVEPLIEALFAAGALDAWSTPIVMKKGRPALEISALAPVDLARAVEEAFFRNSTTIGLRTVDVGRAVLARSSTAVETRFGRVSVKLSALGGEVLAATPEFEDCRRLAAAGKVPVRVVQAEAAAAAVRLLPGGAGRTKRG